MSSLEKNNCVDVVDLVYTWNGANLCWNNNPYCWDDVRIIGYFADGGADVEELFDQLSKKDKDRFITLVCKVHGYKETITQKKIVEKQLTAKQIQLTVNEIKKQLGRSPDYSDALMMRMYFELNPNRGSYVVR